MSNTQPERTLGFNTRALHAGYPPDPTTKARAVPIYQTTSFVFDDSSHAAALFGLQQFGNIYTRIMNPTTDVLEQRVASLENGVAALAMASGQSAQFVAISSLMEPGDHFVAASTLYGGTYTQFDVSFRKFGYDVTFVEPDDPENFRKAIKPNTKLLYGETISNPRGNVLDIEAVAKIAHGANIPLMIDNTFATPYVCRPIDYGADIVIHSLTKFMGGHGTTLGGIIVDSGKFPWTRHAARYPMFNQPDASYHGLVYTEHFGAAAYIARCRSVYQRTIGAVLPPMSAFLLLQGIETVALRVDRHVANARRVAEFLRDDSRVEWLNYAGFPDNPYFGLTQKYLGGRACSLMTFGARGGLEGGTRFYDALKLIKRLVNLGDAKTLACHPASTTHRQMSPAEQLQAGVRPESIRLSIGIEHIDDIIGDIDQALAAATATVS